MKIFLGLSRNMSTRREAFKAFEGRRNSIMAMRRKSQMQTLGANNIYGVAGNPLGIQGRPSRSSQISVKDVFEGHPATSGTGHVNAGYEGDDSPVNSLRLQNLGGNQVTWREANSNVWPRSSARCCDKLTKNLFIRWIYLSKNSLPSSIHISSE